MIKKHLIKAISRSQRAYTLYSTEGSFFFQAKRIYAANLIVYNLLNEYVFVDNSHEKEIIAYIFHLEDWFTQFDYAEKDVIHPSDFFAFGRWEGGIPFPLDFLQIITK